MDVPRTITLHLDAPTYAYVERAHAADCERQGDEALPFPVFVQEALVAYCETSLVDWLSLAEFTREWEASRRG